MIREEIDKKNWELNIFVEADKDLWTKKQEQSLEDIAKTLKIRGFRPGKVPLNVARDNIKNSDILNKAVELIVKDLIKLAAESIKKDIIILDSAVYDIEKMTNSELEIKFTYPIYPEFNLKVFENLPINIEKVVVTDEQINEEIEKIVAKNTLLIEKEDNNGIASNGDVVNIDYVGKVDGEVFEGGSAKDYELKLGSKSFIDTFEEQLIGHKKNDNVDVKVQFPKSYHEEKLAGKYAIFNVKINSVSITEKPAIDDSLVKLVEIPEINTLSELKDHFKNLLIQEGEQRARSNFRKQIFEQIIKNNAIPIPRLVLIKETKKTIEEFKKNIEKYGYTVEKYLEMLNMKEEELVSKLTEESELKLREALIFTEISRLKNIEASEKDYEVEYNKFAKLYKVDVETVKNMVTKEQLQVPIVNEKVIDFLIKHNGKNTSEKEKAINSKTEIKKNEKEVKETKTTSSSPKSKTNNSKTKNVSKATEKSTTKKQKASETK